MNQGTPYLDQKHSTKVQTQTGDTTSISGSIVIQNNCNASQLSSPDVSETNETRKYLSAINLHGNDDKDDKQKTILLKIPSGIKPDQLLV